MINKMLNCLKKDNRKFADCIFKENVVYGCNVDLSKSIFNDYVNIAYNAQVLNSEIGKRTSIGRYSKIRDAIIGKYCSISWDVTIGAVSHPFNRISTHAFSYRKQFGLVEEDTFLDHPKTVIGNDVWIGCNSVIISGVKIGDGAIIGAGAVITKDVKPYEVVAGVPAKVIKKRFSDEIIKLLNDIKWWNLEDDIIKKNIEMFSKDLDINDLRCFIRRVSK